MSKTLGVGTICTIEQIPPFKHVASITLRILGAAGHAVACKPLWEDAFGEFVIGRAIDNDM